MDILFRSRRLQRDCSLLKNAVRRWGDECGHLILARLDDLRAAENLSHMRISPSGRCHELTGDRRGQLSIDVKHPYRLIFTPVDRPVPRKPDGGLDWVRVTQVCVLGVEDTHE